MEELTINPDLLRILVLDEDVVMPRVEQVVSPSTKVGGVLAEELLDTEHVQFLGGAGSGDAGPRAVERRPDLLGHGRLL